MLPVVDANLVEEHEKYALVTQTEFVIFSNKFIFVGPKGRLLLATQ